MRLLLSRFLSSIFFLSVLLAAACSSESGDVQDEVSAEGAVARDARAPLGNSYRVQEAFTVGQDIYVRSISIDEKQQNVWIGTSSGVLLVDLSSRDLKQTFVREAGLANEYVFASHTDTNGWTWFGTNGGGISGYKAGEWKTYFPMHGLADYWVYSFGEQRNGALWIGTWAGVNRFDTQSEIFETYVEQLVNEWVYGIGVDSKDRVWFGTEGGVTMYDGQQWRSWTHADGLGAPNAADLPISANTGLGTRARHDLSVTRGGRETYNPNYVFCVAVDEQDTIWAGTWGGGVARFDGEQWANFTAADGLAGNVVFSVAQDSSGAYWFGTHKGLSRYDGRQWHTYTTQDGLIDNNVYTVQAAANGDVWVGTKNGVARLVVENKS